MPATNAVAREAFETAIGHAIIEHDMLPGVVLTSITNLLVMLIEEAPLSRAQKRKLATTLADRILKAADARHPG